MNNPPQRRNSIQRSQSSNMIIDTPQLLLSPPNSETSNETTPVSSVNSTPPITPNVLSFKGTSNLKDDFTTIDINRDNDDEKELQDFKLNLKKDDWRKEIVNSIIKPNYVKEIKDFISNRIKWKKRGRSFETGSKIFIGIGSILSFSAGVYDSKELSFISGTISVVSMVLLQYATFSYRESGKSTQELNVLLDSIGIKKLPEINTTVQDNGNTPPLQQPIRKEVREWNNYIAPHTSPHLQPQNNNLKGSIEPMLLTSSSGYGFSDTVGNFQRRLSGKKQIDYESTSEDGEYLNVHHLDDILYEDIPIDTRWEKAMKHIDSHPNIKFTSNWITYVCEHNDFIMFKNILNHGITYTPNVPCIVAKSGFKYIHEYNTHDYPLISDITNYETISNNGKIIKYLINKGESSALLGAILSKDLNTLKEVYYKVGNKWLQHEAYELRLARELGNSDILMFCIKNGVKHEPYISTYRSDLKKLEDNWKKNLINKK